MNKPYAGAAMCLPHVCVEVMDRIGEPLSDGDEQANDIALTLLDLSECLYRLARADELSKQQRVKKYSTNHVRYYDFDIIIEMALSSVGSLLQHECCIGEMAANLLANIYVYLSMMEPEEIGDHSGEIARRTHCLLTN